MIIPAKTIPSSFVRFDSEVTAADRWVNARDLHVAAENNNILMARGSVVPLVAQSFRNDDTDEFGEYIVLSSPVDMVSPDGSTGRVVWRNLVSLPHDRFRSIRFTVYASSSASGAYLFFSVSRDGAREVIDPALHKMTISGALAAYELEVDIASGSTEYWVTVYCETPSTDDGAITGTVDDIGPDWVEFSTADVFSQSEINHPHTFYLYFDDPEVAPKEAYKSTAGQTGATNRRHYFYGEFEKLPTVGTTVATIDTPSWINLQSLTVEAVAPTEF